MPFKITLSSPAPISATAQASNRDHLRWKANTRAVTSPIPPKVEKRNGFQHAHGPEGAVLMEKLRDSKIVLRQPRLFTDLVGKVDEQHTRRRHYQQAR